MPARRLWAWLLAVALLWSGLALTGPTPVSAQTPSARAYPSTKAHTISVPSDWAFVPAGVQPGDTFRLMFITNTSYDAVPGDIHSYDRRIHAEAAGGQAAIRPYARYFCTLGSTAEATIIIDPETCTDVMGSEVCTPAVSYTVPAVNAKQHTRTGGVPGDMKTDPATGTEVPIYWIGNNSVGAKVADHYADFWDGSWDSAQGDARNVNGAAVSTWQVWTGTNPSTGEGVSDRELGQDSSKTTVNRDTGFPVTRWNGGPQSTAVEHKTTNRRLLALSDVFYVAPEVGVQDVPADWPFIPEGLSTGDQFRVVFQSEYSYQAHFGASNTWNNKVRGEILHGHGVVYYDSPHLYDYADYFTALVSTDYLDARDNVDMNPAHGEGVPIYWLGGPKIADNNTGFWADARDISSSKLFHHYTKTFMSNGVQITEEVGAWNQHGEPTRPLSVITGSKLDGTKADDDLPPHEPYWPHARRCADDPPDPNCVIKRQGPVGTQGKPATTAVTTWEYQTNTTVAEDRLGVTETQVGDRLLAVSPVFRVAEPAVSLSVSNTRIGEGGVVTATVSLNKASTSDLTVNYQLGGTAQSSDYTVSGTSGQVTIPAGSKKATFTITLANDDDPDDETITITLVDGADDNGFILHPKKPTSRTVTVRSDLVISIEAKDSAVRPQYSTLIKISLSRPLDRGQTLHVPLSFGGTADRLHVTREQGGYTTQVSAPEYFLYCTDEYPLWCGKNWLSGSSAPRVQIRNLAEKPLDVFPTEFYMKLEARYLHSGDKTVQINIGDACLGYLAPIIYFVTVDTDDGPREVEKHTSRPCDVVPAARPYVRVEPNSASVTLSKSAPITTHARPTSDPRPSSDSGYTAPESLVATLRGYVAETQHGQAHVDRWKSALAGLCVEDFAGITAMTAAQAQANSNQFTATRWDPVVTELQKAEAAGCPSEDEQDTQIEDLDPQPSEDSDSQPSSDSATYTAPASLVSTLRGYVAETQHGQAHVARWEAALEGLCVEDFPGITPMTAAQAQGHADEFTATRWDPVVTELTKAEALGCPDDQQVTPPPVVTPAVSIAGGSAVTEGGNAVFTLTASPKPSSSVSVKVDITQSGDYAVSTSQRTVSIGSSGKATLSIATTDDSADEPNGSVTATIASGAGYTGSGSATVTVSDDDDPPVVTPAVSITGGSAAIEGGNAVFTLTATPKPSSSISVKVDITQSGNFAASTAQRTVTIGASGTATLSIATTDDSTDEPNGSVTATIVSGTGYTGSGSATVTVKDDDEPAGGSLIDRIKKAEGEPLVGSALLYVLSMVRKYLEGTGPLHEFFVRMAEGWWAPADVKAVVKEILGYIDDGTLDNHKQ